jgi:hypothetical protein
VLGDCFLGRFIWPEKYSGTIHKMLYHGNTVRLLATGRACGVRFPVRLDHCVQIGCVTDTTSHLRGTAAEGEANNLCLEVKNTWSFTSTTPIRLHCVVLMKHSFGTLWMLDF